MKSLASLTPSATFEFVARAELAVESLRSGFARGSLDSAIGRVRALTPYSSRIEWIAALSAYVDALAPIGASGDADVAADALRELASARGMLDAVKARASLSYAGRRGCRPKASNAACMTLTRWNRLRVRAIAVVGLLEYLPCEESSRVARRLRELSVNARRGDWRDAVRDAAALAANGEAPAGVRRGAAVALVAERTIRYAGAKCA